MTQPTKPKPVVPTAPTQDPSGTPWYRNLDTLGRGAANATMFNNPLAHAALMGGGAYLGTRLARPALEYLYPDLDFSSPYLPWVAGGLAGGAGYLLSNMGTAGRTKTARRRGWTKVASSMFGTFNAHPAFLPRPLASMVQHGVVSPGGAIALQAATGAAGHGGPASPGQVTGTVSSAMRAVGSYLNPVNRLGWAMAGTGASLLTSATGVERGIQSAIGMPTSKAVRKFGPAATLIGRGMQLAGF